MLKERELAREPDDDGTCLRRANRLGPDEHDTPELLLERLDALAHGRRRDVEAAGGGIQRPFVKDNRDRLGEFRRYPHSKSG
ncbi:hypothetical protein GCM10009739_21640 [Microbacterium ulmi]